MIRVLAAPWVLLGRAARPTPALPPRGGDERVDRGARDPRVLRDGALVLDGDRIVAVGPRAELEERHGPADRLDAVVLPALVNAHLHLELSHMAGRVAGGEGLPAWIQLFIAARAGTREGEPEQAMAMAAEDLVRFGVAAVGDITNTLASLEPLARAGLGGTLFHEVFGFSPPRFDAALAAARAVRARAPSSPGLRVVESPHAVYSTHAAALVSLLEAGGPGSLHLAEDPAERAFCATGSGAFGRMYAALGASFAGLRIQGRSAVAAVAPHLRPHHLVVHCVDLDDEDVALLARSGATVVLCPRSNRFIVGALPPVPRLLAAGVPLAIGTDSLASSPSLAPLAEVAALHVAFSEVPLLRLLEAAWNGPAVGAPGVGALVPGSAPGILAAPLGGARVDDPLAFLASTFGAEERPFTWLARPRPESST